MSENEIRTLFDDDVKNGYVYFDKIFNQYVYLYCGEEIMSGKTLDDAFKTYDDIIQYDISEFGVDGFKQRLADIESEA